MKKLNILSIFALALLFLGNNIDAVEKKVDSAAIKKDVRASNTITIWFPDTNLASVVAKKLGKDVSATVSDTELSDIKELKNTTESISNLKGIENLKNLEILKIKNGKISNISILEKLTKLLEVDLSGNNIEDISVFYNLEYLKKLNISNNMVKDLTVLEDVDLGEIIDLTEFIAHSQRVEVSVPNVIVNHYEKGGSVEIDNPINPIVGSTLTMCSNYNKDTNKITWTGIKNASDKIECTFNAKNDDAVNFSGEITLINSLDPLPLITHKTPTMNFDLGKTPTKAEYISHFNLKATENGADISSKIELDTSAVKVNEAGSYKIKASVTNSKGSINAIEVTAVFKKETAKKTTKVVKKGNTTEHYQLKVNALSGKDAWFNNKTEIISNNVKTIHYFTYNKAKLKSNNAVAKNGSALNKTEITTYSNNKFVNIIKKQITLFNANEKRISLVTSIYGTNKKVLEYRSVLYNAGIIQKDKYTKFSKDGTLRLGARKYEKKFDAKGRITSHYQISYHKNGRKSAAFMKLYNAATLTKNTFHKYSLNGKFSNKSYKQEKFYYKGVIYKAAKLAYQGNSKRLFLKVRTYQAGIAKKQAAIYYNKQGYTKGEASRINVFFNKNGKPTKAYQALYNKKGKLGKYKKTKITKFITSF